MRQAQVPHAGHDVTAQASTAGLPRHIAIIMDGNGRWAQQQGLPRIEGHRRGVATVRRITEHCARRGIEQLTLYCLSSENWRRPEAELRFLMHLLEQYVIEERGLLMRERIRLAMIGRREGLPATTLAELDRTVAMCAANDGMRLCLAINYGARGGASFRDGDRDGDLGLPGAQGRQGGLDIGVELLRDLGVGRGHRQADGDLALGRDLDALEEAEGDDVSAEARVADLGQRLLDGILVECHEQD